jgi:hypothetical protein
MRVVIAVSLLLLCSLTAIAQESTSPAPPAAQKPVWRASELGHFIATRMPPPNWEDVETDAATVEGVNALDLRLQLQVIEAHAVGQALREPFQASVARDAFMVFFGERFPAQDQEPIRLGLQMWGIAYSGSVQEGRGDESVTLTHIRRVFANSLEIDKSEALAARGSDLWRKTLAEVIATCHAALREAVVVPN